MFSFKICIFVLFDREIVKNCFKFCYVKFNGNINVIIEYLILLFCLINLILLFEKFNGRYQIIVEDSLSDGMSDRK